MREDAEYLGYVARSIDLIRDWTRAGREDFINDVRTQAAVLYHLQTLTQALGTLPAEHRARYAEVPFRAMKGFRNVIVHDYLSLKMDVVWSVVEEYLPQLQPQVAQMIADL
jgi:uncharacterized protein with HEPN domain